MDETTNTEPAPEVVSSGWFDISAMDGHTASAWMMIHPYLEDPLASFVWSLLVKYEQFGLWSLPLHADEKHRLRALARSNNSRQTGGPKPKE